MSNAGMGLSNSTPYYGQGLANAINPHQQAMTGTLAQHAAAHQHQINQWNSIHARQAQPPARWRVDGKDVSFQEFVDIVFPGDTPERTFFLLKFSK